jgi:hypothetical protein
MAVLIDGIKLFSLQTEFSAFMELKIGGLFFAKREGGYP